MATRANIIVQTAPDTFKVIYTHSDGYPAWMGVYLDRFHNTEKAAKEIVRLGPMSELGARLAPNEGEKHSFDYRERAAFCSTFYKRDCDPKSRSLKTWPFGTLNEALNSADNEYVYVWLQGKGWHICPADEDTGAWLDPVPLAGFLRADEKCLERIAQLDEQGMTVEWRDAGCPHERVEKKYEPRFDPKPIGWKSASEKRVSRYENEALF